MEIERASLMSAYARAPQATMGVFGVDDAIALTALVSQLFGGNATKEKRVAVANSLISSFGLDYVSGAQAAGLDVSAVENQLVTYLKAKGINITSAQVRALASAKTNSASSVISNATNYLPYIAVAAVGAFLLMRH